MNSILRNCSNNIVRCTICGLLFALVELCPAAAAPGGSPADWQAVSNGAPVRVAVFVGNGARNQGAYCHLMMAAYANGVKGFPVDGKMIRPNARAQRQFRPQSSSPPPPNASRFLAQTAIVPTLFDLLRIVQ